MTIRNVNYGTGKKGAIEWMISANKLFIKNYTPEQEANDRARLDAELKEGSYWISDEGVEFKG